MEETKPPSTLIEEFREGWEAVTKGLSAQLREKSVKFH